MLSDKVPVAQWLAHASPKGKDGGSNPSGHHVYGLTLNETNNPRYHTAMKKPQNFLSVFRSLRDRRVATHSSRKGNVWHVKSTGI